MTCDQHRPPSLRRPKHCHRQSSSGARMQGIEQRRPRTAHMQPVVCRRVIHLTYPPEEAIGAVGLLAPSVAAERGFTPIDRSLAHALDRHPHLLTHCTSIHRSRKTQQQGRRRHQRKLLRGGRGSQRSVKPPQHVCSGNLKPCVLCMHLSRHWDDAE